MKLANPNDLNVLINLMKKPSSQTLDLIKNIEVFTFAMDIDDSHLENDVQTLIKLLQNCPSLISINFHNINQVTLSFSLPPFVTSFTGQSFTNLSHLTINNAPKLDTFFIQSISEESEVIFNSTPLLTSFTFENISDESSLILDSTPNLVKAACGKIDSECELYLQSASHLDSLSFTYIQSGAKLYLPNSLPNLTGKNLNYSTNDTNIDSMLENLRKKS